jgi:hypothetical protein
MEAPRPPIETPDGFPSDFDEEKIEGEIAKYRVELQNMSSLSYVGACTAEAFAAAIVFSPVFGAVSFVNAILRARYFRATSAPVQQ